MTTQKPSNLSAEEVARLVVRRVAKRDAQGRIVHDEHGNPVPVEQSIQPEEVMSHAEYHDRVVVVTTSGEKLTCEKSSDGWKNFAKGRK